MMNVSHLVAHAWATDETDTNGPNSHASSPSSPAPPLESDDGSGVVGANVVV